MDRLPTNEKGFTLIELLVVVVLVGALVAIAVPRYQDMTLRSRLAVDQANLRILNSATQFFWIGAGMPNQVFAGVNSDSERMAALVSQGFLQRSVEAVVPGNSFYWHGEAQRWLSTLFQYASDTFSRWFFPELNPADYRKVRDWVVSEEGFRSLPGGSEQLIFFENGRAAYTITLNAVLDPGTDGGYGILFESTLNESNQDTGYILQFDRGIGNGAVIIRQRTNASESHAVKTVSHSDSPYIPSKQDDPDWWASPHQIRLQVQPISGDPGFKHLSVWIDGNLIISNWRFESSIDPAQNWTGLRSWRLHTTFTELQIQ